MPFVAARWIVSYRLHATHSGGWGFDRTIASGTGDRLGATIERNGIGSLRGAVGTPDQVRELLREYEEVGVDQVIFVAQAGNNRHEHICEALELFADQVMPEFAERDPAAQEVKAERLAPVIAAALARREPARELEGYSFGAAAAV